MYFVILAINLLVGIGTLANADAEYTEYFRGTARTEVLASGSAQQSVVPVLLKRQTSRETATVTEVVTYLATDGKAEDSSSIITITDSQTGSVSLMNATGSVTGQGSATGSDWRWTKMSFDLQSQSGAKIADTRYFAKQKIIMRKVITLNDGKTPGYLWEADFMAMTRDEYLAEFERMHQTGNSVKQN